MNPLGALLGLLVTLVALGVWCVVSIRARRQSRSLPGWVDAVAVLGCLAAGYAVGAAYYTDFGLDWLRRQQAAGRTGLTVAVESSVEDVRRLAWSLVLVAVCSTVVAYQLGRSRCAGRQQEAEPAEAVGR